MSGVLWLQVSAGQGPLECEWAAWEVTQRLLGEAQAAGLGARVVGGEAGGAKGAVRSALVALETCEVRTAFVRRWAGTVQWIARSPFRPQHRRKNWFVDVRALEPPGREAFRKEDVRVETMRAGGPGGQHVNRTESAVRAKHVPTGLTAVASEERSQRLNRELALARVARKIEERNATRSDTAKRTLRDAHHGLQRGNAVRVLRP